MCQCRLFTSEDGRNQIIEAIRSFKNQEFIYAALPYGAYSFLPDPQRMIVTDKKHVNLDRLTEYKVNNKLHSKYLIGPNKIIWGSGNMTETSIYDKHETYEIVHKKCHPEKYSKIFRDFKQLWKRSETVKQQREEVGRL